MTTPELILEGLGGAGNVAQLEACITRLRVEVEKPDLVSETVLKDAGAFGVVQVDDIVQVVVGPSADKVAESVNALR